MLFKLISRWEFRCCSRTESKLPVVTACTFIDVTAVATLDVVDTISAKVLTISGVGTVVGIGSC